MARSVNTGGLVGGVPGGQRAGRVFHQRLEENVLERMLLS